MANFLLTWFWIFIHDFIDLVIDAVFAIIYKGKKKTIPAIKNPILLKSAAALAEAIRKREVSLSVT